MKLMHTLVLSGLIAAATAASAETSLDNWKLGRMQGILDMCRSASPQQATQYLLQMKSAIGDATRQMVNQAAKTEQYQQAYQQVRAELSGMAHTERAQACQAYMVE